MLKALRQHPRMAGTTEVLVDADLVSDVLEQVDGRSIPLGIQPSLGAGRPEPALFATTPVARRLQDGNERIHHKPHGRAAELLELTCGAPLRRMESPGASPLTRREGDLGLDVGLDRLQVGQRRRWRRVRYRLVIARFRTPPGDDGADHPPSSLTFRVHKGANNFPPPIAPTGRSGGRVAWLAVVSKEVVQASGWGEGVDAGMGTMGVVVVQPGIDGVAALAGAGVGRRLLSTPPTDRLPADG
jgi:hypothetical protein